MCAAMLGYAVTRLFVVMVQNLLGSTLFSFVLMVAGAAIIPNLLWAVLFFRDSNFKELIQIIVTFIKTKRGS